MNGQELVYIFGDAFFKVFGYMMLFTVIVGLLSVVTALLVAIGRVLAAVL